MARKKRRTYSLEYKLETVALVLEVAPLVETSSRNCQRRLATYSSLCIDLVVEVVDTALQIDVQLLSLRPGPLGS
jgi:hypothetical protein